MVPVLETPFGFSISFEFWQMFMEMSLNEQLRLIFVFLWWLPITPLFHRGLKEFLALKQKRFDSTCTWSVLAVDIPSEVIQSPRAVEQIFTHFSGIYEKIGLYDKYWLGKKQKFFSLEIISLEGYIQFLIRTPSEYRDLVEAAIYAQYPEAEITEVEDYVTILPDTVPNDLYDVAGVEFDLLENEVYPIRTYSQFEHSLYKEAPFIDPMAAILENFTRISSGENLWMQLIIEPVDNSWKKNGIDLVKNLLSGKKAPPKPTAAQSVVDVAEKILHLLWQIWHHDFSPREKKKEESKGEISPDVKDAVNGIENKITKLGFKSRLRLLYCARKELFNPKKCINGFIGSINQFYIANQNGFKSSFISGEDLVSAYKKRKIKLKTDPYILNIEELATLWHFPMPTVKAPLIQKTGGKRSEPPTNLPVEIMEGKLKFKEEVKEPELPEQEELPYA